VRRFLPYGGQEIDSDDIAAVTKALGEELLTTGPLVGAFETAIRETVGSEHAVVCNSGTAALHLASMALKLGPDDQVVVPTITFVATANAPHFTGAEVVFADVDPDTGLLTAEHLEDALQRAPKAKACFPVHLNGNACNMAAIQSVAARHGVRIIEDACHALGGAYNDGTGHIGDCRYADMAVFSFHPVKSIAMGEGGAVTTNAQDFADRARLLRSHGLLRDANQFEDSNQALAFDQEGALNPWYYEMQEPGFNYRAPDILCALGLSQIGKLGRFVETRRSLAATYDRLLEPLAPVALPVSAPYRGTSAYHLYPILIDFEAAGCTRAHLMDALRRSGIGTQVHYVPVHLQPFYRKRCGDLQLPGAIRYYERVLALPLSTRMTPENAVDVAVCLAEALGLEDEMRAAHPKGDSS
jgi:UDP-4-amino-4,6-dideoxy-N-acetyl-beta-L-altrosamine transaminase